MPANADSGNIIATPNAKTLINNFRANSTYYEKDHPVRGVKGAFYGKNKILAILNQPNCIGLRYYFGLNGNGQLVIVLSGEDSNGAGLNGVVVEEGPLCPPFCGRSNTLDGE